MVVCDDVWPNPVHCTISDLPSSTDQVYWKQTHILFACTADQKATRMMRLVPIPDNSTACALFHLHPIFHFKIRYRYNRIRCKAVHFIKDIPSITISVVLQQSRAKAWSSKCSKRDTHAKSNTRLATSSSTVAACACLALLVAKARPANNLRHVRRSSRGN